MFCSDCLYYGIAFDPGGNKCYVNNLEDFCTCNKNNKIHCTKVDDDFNVIESMDGGENFVSCDEMIQIIKTVDKIDLHSKKELYIHKIREIRNREKKAELQGKKLMKELKKEIFYILVDQKDFERIGLILESEILGNGIHKNKIDKVQFKLLDEREIKIKVSIKLTRTTLHPITEERNKDFLNSAIITIERFAILFNENYK